MEPPRENAGPGWEIAKGSWTQVHQRRGAEGGGRGTILNIGAGIKREAPTSIEREDGGGGALR